MSEVENKYRIVSSAMLPMRFKGMFNFDVAYQLCCDWNTWHLAQDRAWPEKIDDSREFKRPAPPEKPAPEE